MASSDSEHGKKLRILLVPFFVSSHICPFTDLAVRLAAATPDTVEPTIAVTPANVATVRAALERHGASAASRSVKIVTYPFPDVEGLPLGVENLTSAGGEVWCIDAAAIDEALTRPAQEALIRDRELSLGLGAVFTDVHFFWNPIIAGELGVPSVTFSVIGPFTTLAMHHLAGTTDGEDVVFTGFRGPDQIRIPSAELPEFMRCPQKQDQFRPSWASRSFGLAFNTLLDMERQYCELYPRHGNAKHAYFVGPLSLQLHQPDLEQ